MKTLKVKFSFLQIFYWSSVACFIPFAVAFARTKGISAIELGIMSSLFKGAAFIGQFFWGTLSDRYQSNKRVLLVSYISLFIFSLIYYYCTNRQLILLFYALMGFIQPPISSNIDSWILKYFYETPEAYGPIRALGSLGYALVSFFYGNLLIETNYTIVPVTLAILTLITLISIFSLKDSPYNKNTIKKTISIKDFKKLLSNNTYLILLIILFFVGLTTVSISQMKYLIYENMGAGVGMLGYDVALSAFAQVPVMALIHYLIRIKTNKRILIAIILDFVALIVMFLTNNAYVVVGCSVLSGFAYGFMIPAYREIILYNTTSQLKTTAQGIGDAVYSSLAGIISGVLFGSIIELFGVKTMLLICIVIFILPLLVTIYFVNNQKFNKTNFSH